MKNILTLLTLFSSVFIFAQDSLDLAPVTVTAPAWADGADVRPVAALGRRGLAENYYGQEPALLLERLPSVTAYTESGSGFGYANFRLRGIDQTRLNFTLDGVPLNEPEDQGFYFNNYVDLLSSIRAVQVQPGVNVGVNGTAAYAGSVQLLSPAIGGKSFTEFSTGYGSYGSYRASAALRKTNAESGWSVYGRGTVLGSEGYKEHSDHEGRSAFLQAGHTGKKNLLKFTVFGGNQKNQMAWLGVRDSILQVNPRTNGNAEDEQDDFTTTLAKAQYTRLVSATTQWSTSLYHGFQNGNYDFDLNNFLDGDIGEDMYNYAFRYHNVGLLTNLSYVKDGWDIRAGLHAQDHTRRHTGSHVGVGVLLYTNTGHKNDFSGFTSIARKTNLLHLRAAAQLRHVSFGYDGAVALDAIQNTFLNYELSATYPLGKSSLYYRFGSTGREPTRNDVFGGNDDLLPGDNGPLTFVTEPETVFDHELGLRGNSNAFTYLLNAYYLRFKNEIVLSGAFGPNGLPLRSSVAKSYRAGLEYQLAYRPAKAWEIHANGTLSDSQIEQDDTSFAPVLSPNVLLNQGVAYRPGNWSFGLDLRYQGSSYIDFANDNELEAFATLDARASWTKGRWTISALAFNLSGADYAANGALDVYGRPTFHWRAGVNGWMSVRYKW
jgi:iron complex outermembrane receptor protein